MKQLSLVLLLFLCSAPAMAYVGPGLGLGVIGTIFGVLAAIVLALFGLFWYPLKRAFSKKKATVHSNQADPTVARNEQAVPPDTLPAQTQNPSKTNADNHVTNPPGAPHEVSEPVTANRTDNLVK